MTIQQVIDTVDSTKPNAFSYEQKVAWLSEVDHQAYREILSKHEGMTEGYVFEGYTKDTPPDTVLLIPDVYAEVYEHAIARKMDHKYGELDKYENDNMLFNSLYQTFWDYWTRTHRPLTPVTQFQF